MGPDLSSSHSIPTVLGLFDIMCNTQVAQLRPDCDQTVLNKRSLLLLKQNTRVDCLQIEWKISEQNVSEGATL